MADRFAAASGAGQIYDEKARTFESVVKEYLLAWAALLEDADPLLALANTVEIQSLSGRTIGLSLELILNRRFELFRRNRVGSAD